MKATELVIDFSALGEVQAMHLDEFDLGFLGSKSVSRATEIVFCGVAQAWGLFLPSPQGEGWVLVEAGQGFATYETARQFEVHWLNVCRAEGTDPASAEGNNTLASIRQAACGVSYAMTLDALRSWRSSTLPA